MTESKRKTPHADAAAAPEHCVDRFIAELGLGWTSAPEADASPVFRSIFGHVAALPDPAAVARAITAIGFEATEVFEEMGLREHFGRRGKERLACRCLDPSERDAPRMSVEWRSGERPPITGGVFEWFDRSWPVFFGEASLFAASRTLFIVEGRIPPSGFGDIARAYREWASAHAMSPYADVEPDMRGDLQVADDAFVVTVTDRDPYVTIAVRKEDAGS